MRRAVIVLVALAVVFAACGDSETSTTETTTPATTSAPATSTAPPPLTTLPDIDEARAVSSYLMSEAADGGGPYLVPLHRFLAPGEEPGVAEAIDMMLEGETFTEAGMGVTTAIPRDTTLLGVSVAEGVATIDLSEQFDDGGGTLSMWARLAQVVYTATQVEGVDRVALAMEGAPVAVFSGEGIDLTDPLDRDTFADLRNPVFVETPAWGELVDAQFTVAGITTAVIVSCAVVDWDGVILHEVSTELAAAEGWQPFSMRVALAESDVGAHPSGSFDLSLVVWEGPLRAGQQAHLVEYPLFFTAPDQS